MVESGTNVKLVRALTSNEEIRGFFKRRERKIYFIFFVGALC